MVKVKAIKKIGNIKEGEVFETSKKSADNIVSEGMGIIQTDEQKKQSAVEIILDKFHGKDKKEIEVSCYSSTFATKEQTTKTITEVVELIKQPTIECRFIPRFPENSEIDVCVDVLSFSLDIFPHHPTKYFNHRVKYPSL